MRPRAAFLVMAVATWLGSTAPPVTGQQVLLEGAVRAGGLWCFPLASDPLGYLYLPDRAALAEDDEGRPQFSLVRYVANRATGADRGETITEAGGGGILTLLVSYGVSDEVRRRAERDLRDLTDNDEARLRGPMLFQEGSYSLVSSILGGEAGNRRQVLATGRAPVLEGNRIALSFELDPERSTLLIESFRTATPDVSLVFDMEFVGLAPAFGAELVIDWSKVRRHRSFDAGGTVFWVGLEVERAIDEMLRDNTIELRSRGSDASMEALLQSVYDRLITLMFEPVALPDVPEQERGDLVQALSKLVEPETLADIAGKTTGFGLSAGYRAKVVRDSGHTVLRFDHQAALERHATIAFNIGELWERWGDDPAFFRTVNLADPAFEQREVRVGVDGALLPELDRFVNSVTVTLEKEHQDGSRTVRELVVDGRTFGAEQPDLRMVYGWNGDDDRDRWLEYRYRTRWSFRDGGSLDTGWTGSGGSIINLYVPYQRRSVELIGDPEVLRGRGVRAVVVEISHPFFGDTLRQQQVIRLDRPLEEQALELTLPRDQFAYDYRVTWHMAGAPARSRSGTDTSGLVFIDEMPEEESR